MFSNNKSKETGKVSGASTIPVSNAFNSLVQGTVVEGDIKSKNDIRVDGKIKGSLKCESKVVIGPSGSVEGEVNCQHAVVEGHFDGKLHVSQLLTIKDTAKVNGEIRYGKLVVQPGATLIGDVRLAGSVQVNLPKQEKQHQTYNAGNKPSQTGNKAEKETANR